MRDQGLSPAQSSCSVLLLSPDREAESSRVKGVKESKVSQLRNLDSPNGRQAPESAMSCRSCQVLRDQTRRSATPTRKMYGTSSGYWSLRNYCKQLQAINCRAKAGRHLGPARNYMDLLNVGVWGCKRRLEASVGCQLSFAGGWRRSATGRSVWCGKKWIQYSQDNATRY